MEAISEQRKLGHEIRNHLNALNLNAACLKICEPDEALQCVDSIIEACGDLLTQLDRLEQLLPETSDETLAE